MESPSLDAGGETGWSRELLYQLVESLRDYAIFVADLGGTIVSWNVGAERLFGYTPEEAIGLHMQVLFTPEDRADQIPEIEMATARREGHAEDERWHIRKEGTRFFVSGLQTALYDDAGIHTGYAKIARDLTERILAQEEIRKTCETVDEKVAERTSGLVRTNDELRLAIYERDEADRLRGLILRKVAAAQEGERKRIARDLHDNIGQQTTALRLLVQSLLAEDGNNAQLTEKLRQPRAIR